MLFRVSGRLANNTPFTTRVEAPSIIGAVSTARSALNESGTPDEAISELRVRPAKGGKSIRFGNPNAPKRTRKAPVTAGAASGAASDANTPTSTTAPAATAQKAAGAAAKK
jgi:hypothetical protein